MDLVQFIVKLFPRWRSKSSSFERPENQAHQLGRFGEKLAARYLQRHGFKVIYRNFRATHGGEVDLVCRDKKANTLVFVEVKTRSSDEHGAPSEAVNRQKQHLISRGALAWLKLLDHPNLLFRFDIVEIVMHGNGPKINLIRNAFPLSTPYIY